MSKYRGRRQIAAHRGLLDSSRRIGYESSRSTTFDLEEKGYSLIYSRRDDRTIRNYGLNNHDHEISRYSSIRIDPKPLHTENTSFSYSNYPKYYDVKKDLRHSDIKSSNSDLNESFFHKNYDISTNHTSKNREYARVSSYNYISSPKYYPRAQTQPIVNENESNLNRTQTSSNHSKLDSSYQNPSQRDIKSSGMVSPKQTNLERSANSYEWTNEEILGTKIFQSRGVAFLRFKSNLQCTVKDLTSQAAFISDSEGKKLIFYGEVNRDKTYSRGILFEKEFTYVGEFKNGVFSGNGVQIFPENKYFEGRWENGKKERGSLFDHDGSLLESGEYNDKEELEGKGCALLCAGEIYWGSVKAGKRDGEGCQYYGSTSIQEINKTLKLNYLETPIVVGPKHYEGSWLNDLKEGQIKIYDTDGKLVRERTFKNGTEVSTAKKSAIRIIESELTEDDLKKPAAPDLKSLSICKPDYVLSEEEIKRLVGSNWLSSNNLNFYLNYLTNEVLEGKRADAKILALGTRVDEYMKKKPSSMTALQNSTRRYTLPCDKAGRNEFLLIFDLFDRILFPITLGNHWTLAEINCQDKNKYKFRIYDSMFSGKERGTDHHSEHLKIVYDYFEFEVRDKIKDDKIISMYLKRCQKEWSDDIPEVGQQQNGSDCGVFTLGFAEHLFEGKPLIEFTQEKAREMRKRLKDISITELGRIA